jgi:hypothetical protein
MEANRSLKQAANQPLRLPSLRTILWGILALAAVGGAWALWNHLEKQPSIVRWKVVRYLKRQSHTRDFSVPFPFPSKAEMASRTSDSASGSDAPEKSFESLCDEYYTLKTAALRLEIALTTNVVAEAKASLEADLESKEAALAPIVHELWEHQRTANANAGLAAAVDATPVAQAENKLISDSRKAISEANSYSEIYKYIGQQLWVANGLLASKRMEHRRLGVSLALNACRGALNDAENGWVAARICEAYILPNEDVATDTNKRSALNPENFLNECANIFRRNNEYAQVAVLYQKELARAKTSQRADWARSQLARTFEDAGDIQSAVHYLRAIQNTNDYRWINRRLPRLEAQLKVH